MAHTRSERFEIVRVLSRMFGVITRNFPVFAILALVLTGVPGLAAAAFDRGLIYPFGRAAAGSFGLGWIFTLVFHTLLQAALIKGAISDLSGRRRHSAIAWKRLSATSCP
jgi:hypothetical protein